MAKRHDIPITAEVEGVLNDRSAALIRRAIRTTLELEGVELPCEVNVCLTDDAGIHAVNLDMRGVDHPTDVLSFPMFDIVPGEPPVAEDTEFLDPATGRMPLGDMILSMERVAAQAEEFGHSTRRELAYLTVHSALHLLGYDHLDEGEEKARMRAREDAVMAALNILR